MTPLWLGGLLPVATAVLLSYVGVLTARRPTDRGSVLAMRMFAAWWFCAALVILLASAPTLLTLAGAGDVGLMTTISQLTAAPLAVGLCGLLYYLLYIYTGRRDSFWALVAVYAAFFAFELVYYGSFGPRHIETSAFAVRTIPDARPPSWMRVVFGLAVGVPVIAAIVAYASLYPRTREKPARRRIAMVSSAFAIWFVPVVLALVLGASEAPWFPLVYQVPGVIAAVLIVLAYRSPSSLRS